MGARVGAHVGESVGLEVVGTLVGAGVVGLAVGDAVVTGLGVVCTGAVVVGDNVVGNPLGDALGDALGVLDGTGVVATMVAGSSVPIGTAVASTIIQNRENSSARQSVSHSLHTHALVVNPSWHLARATHTHRLALAPERFRNTEML